MKSRKYLWLTVVATVVAWSCPVQSAEAAQAKDAAGQRVAQLKERLKGVIQELELTREQRETLRPLLHEQKEKLRELRQDQSLSRREKLQRFKAIQEELEPKLKKVLTVEQFEKWQSEREKVREQVRKRVRGLQR